jgi:hypothetical protein
MFPESEIIYKALLLSECSNLDETISKENDAILRQVTFMKRIHIPSVAAGTFKCDTSIGSWTSRETHSLKKAWRGKGKIVRAHEALCYTGNKFGM